MDSLLILMVNSGSIEVTYSACVSKIKELKWAKEIEYLFVPFKKCGVSESLKYW